VITRRAERKHERSQQLTASVQAPTKYGFAINLKTATTLLARADEVIE
jgi:hypothetical protein